MSPIPGGRGRRNRKRDTPYLPSYLKDGEKCVVCEDKATGLHYRAITCEGCKGFFRRVFQKNISHYACKGRGKCDVNKLTRNTCQKCRLMKCLSSGMSPELVLNELDRKAKKQLIERNRSKKELYRIQFLLNNAYLSSLCRENLTTINGFINQTSKDYCSRIDLPLNIPFDLFGQPLANQCRFLSLELMVRSLSFITSFEAFQKLDLSEQSSLLRESRGWLEIHFLRVIHQIDLSNWSLMSNNPVFCPMNGAAGARSFLSLKLPTQLIHDLIFLAESTQKLELNNEELAIVSAILLFEQQKLSNNSQLSVLVASLYENLQLLNERNLAFGEYERVDRWICLMLKINNLRSIVRRHFNTFFNENYAVRDRDAEWRFWGLGIFASTVSIGTAACYYARCESDGNDKIDLTKLFTQVFVKKAYLQEVQKNENDRDPPDRSDLPTFSFDEVKRHGKNSDRIWVVFKQGVYDITDFVKLHPGGDKILLAAGGSVEPFWKIYAQHKTPEVLEILEDYRIGNLNEKDIEKIDEHPDDPFSSDPIRHPALIVNSQKPFNAETPASLLIDNFRTHNDLFFVRNHMPVPHINEKEHRVVVEGLGIKQPISLTIDELKTKFEPVSIDSVVQCAGNRRNDMHNFKKVQGLMWTGTAISNAKWTGCRLREVLMSAGIDPDDKRLRHVQFVGEDADATGTHYGASIPFHKAMRPEVILAYSMNDDALPLDHGYPVRLIAPGIVGARQVKWLSKIIVSDKESASHWQQRDYKALPPSIQIGDNMPFEKYPAIQEYPVQSTKSNYLYATIFVEN